MFEKKQQGSPQPIHKPLNEDKGLPPMKSSIPMPPVKPPKQEKK